MSETLGEVNFDIIRYANCWEDAGVLLHAVRNRTAQRIAIIASAGDNALALLSSQPKEITAFDISLPQLYLSELKQTAFDRLEYEELLQFLGIQDGSPGQRMLLWKHLSENLSHNTRSFWQERSAVIEKGIIHCGKFERYFSIFRRHCLPLVHTHRTTASLLQLKADAEQALFYHQHWNTLSWRILMSIFFSKFVMGRAGRDPQFLKQVRLSVPQYIRQKAAAHLQSAEATCNHFLHYIFTGAFGDVLPHYLRPEHYEAIRANIGRLTLRHCSANEIVALQAHDAYCLSNIFEYFSNEQFNATVNSWTQLLQPRSLLLYWNLMVPRSFSQTAPDAFRSEIDYGIPDNGFFYSAFLKEQKV